MSISCDVDKLQAFETEGSESINTMVLQPATFQKCSYWLQENPQDYEAVKSVAKKSTKELGWN
jgi:hypothetical protein